MSRYKPLFVVLFLAAAALIACTKSESASEEATFELLLTGTPADEATALTVNFSDIKLVSVNAADDPVITMDGAGGSFDVLQFQNGKTTLLADATIPDGSYSQLRLVVKSATITVENEVRPITIPSGAQSGLKINIEPPLSARGGKTSTVTLDFNAKRVIQTGNGAYQMSPTALRAVSVSGALTGSLVNSKGEPLEGGLIGVEDAQGNPITATSSDAKGKFKIITLLEGEYTVTMSLEDYVTQTFKDVAILADGSTRLSEDGKIVLLSKDEVIEF